MNDIVYELSLGVEIEFEICARGGLATCFVAGRNCSALRLAQVRLIYDCWSGESAVGHDRDSCWARAALSCAQQPIIMRPCGRWWFCTKSTKRVREQNGERERECTGRERCAFSRFLKWTLWLAFFGHAKIFSCSPLSLACSPFFSHFVACTLPAIPVKFPSRTSRNLSEKKTRNSTYYPEMPGDGTRRRTMHYLAGDLCCWRESKVLARPISLRRHWQKLAIPFGTNL